MKRMGMQTSREKSLQRLAAIVGELLRIAKGLGDRYKVAGDAFQMEGRTDTFQLKRKVRVDRDDTRKVRVHRDDTSVEQEKIWTIVWSGAAWKPRSNTVRSP